MNIDKTQATQFLTMLAEGESVTFQTIDDHKGLKRRHLNQIYHGDIDEQFEKLERLNQQGAGVFVMVNEGDEKGRKAENVQQVRALFVDLDDALLEPILKAPLEPHIIVESSLGRYHAYWLVQDCPLDQFKHLQSQLATKFNGDRSVNDLPRVMRLPGFLWNKAENGQPKVEPFMTKIERLNKMQPYSLDYIVSMLELEPPQRATSPDRPLVVREVAPESAERVRSALGYCGNASDYTVWVHKVGMALHHEYRGNETGFGLFCDWSEQYPNYSLKECRAKWDSFGKGSGTPITIATLFHWAKENGWRDNDSSLDAVPPPKIGQEAFHGILREIVKVGTENSEATSVAIAMNVITRFSAMIGRGAYTNIGDTRLHCRPFAILVGNTAMGRKGTSENLPHRVFNRAEEILKVRASGKGNIAGFDYQPLCVVQGGLASGEGLAFKVRDDSERVGKDGAPLWHGVTDKRLLVIESEFATVAAKCRGDKSILSPTIRNAWDGKTLENLTKTEPYRATNPHIVIVGHITGSELVKRVDEVEISNGLLNRFLICHVGREKLVAHPKPVPDEKVEALAIKIADAVQHATPQGYEVSDAMELAMDMEAEEYWSKIYPKLSKALSGRVGALMARAAPYGRMLSMIFALLDSTTTIGIVHIKAAEAWLAYVEESIRYIFGEHEQHAKSQDAELLAEKIFEIVKARGKATQTEINNALLRKKTGGELSAAIDFLTKEVPSRIDWHVEKTQGRSRTVYFVRELREISEERLAA